MWCEMVEDVPVLEVLQRNYYVAHRGQMHLPAKCI